MTTFAADNFGRTVASGLGTADTGGVWAHNGAAALWSVASGKGIGHHSAAGSEIGAYLTLSASPQLDMETLCSVEMDQVPVGSGGMRLGFEARKSASTTAYRAVLRVRPAANGGHLVNFIRNNAGTPTTIGTTLTLPGTVDWSAADTVIWCRFRVEGVSPCNLSVKFWKDGDAEPVGWTHTATDATALTAPGGAGWLHYLAGGGTVANISHDAFSITDIPTAAAEPTPAGGTFGVTAPTVSSSAPARPQVLYSDPQLDYVAARLLAGLTTPNDLSRYWDQAMVASAGANKAWKIGLKAGHTDDQCHFFSPNYVPSGVTAMTDDTGPTYHMTGDSQNAMDDAKAVHGLALRWRLKGHAGCGTKGVAVIRSLVTYLDHVTVNGNSGQKLQASWFWRELGPGAAILWNHPDFDTALKNQFNQWSWDVFMLGTASPPKSNTGVVLNHTQGGNWEFGMVTARIYIGYLQTDATRRAAIIASARAQLQMMTRAAIYWTGDYHPNLGAPIPPWPAANSQFDTADEMAKYYGTPTAAQTFWFNGRHDEVSRDISHAGMAVEAQLASMLTLYINGVTDAFDDPAIPGGIDRLRTCFDTVLGGWWREALDVGWASPYNGKLERVDDTNDPTYLGDSSWTPAGTHNGRNWAALNMGTYRNGVAGASEFVIAGSFVDHFPPLARYCLKFVAGQATPHLDSIMARTKGTGARTASNAAGVGVITASDMTMYPAMMFLEEVPASGTPGIDFTPGQATGQFGVTAPTVTSGTDTEPVEATGTLGVTAPGVTTGTEASPTSTGVGVGVTAPTVTATSETVDPPEIVVPVALRAGDRHTRVAVVICNQGSTNPLWEVPFATAGFDRVLNDTSEGQAFIPGKDIWRCCDELSKYEPWAHELTFLGIDGPLWSGPLLDIRFENGGVTLYGRDRSHWLTRRFIHQDHTYTQTDIASIFRAYGEDAMQPNRRPNLRFSVATVGQLADRAVKGAAHRYAFDEMTELATTGVDWTTVVEWLHAGIKDATIESPVYQLDYSDLQNVPLISKNGGEAMGTRWLVAGAGGGENGDVVVGDATDSAAQQKYGLIERRVDEETILENGSAQKNAVARLKRGKRPENRVQGFQLIQGSDIGNDILVPGRLFELELDSLCAPVSGRMRLQRSSWSWAPVDDATVLTRELTFLDQGDENLG
jgi:hypothetical protein